MRSILPPPVRGSVVYPESDGKPMADNTLQFQWIVTIKEGLEAVFRDDPNVFVAGDLLWYPVEGEPGICAAPDTLVVFGRPKGHRRSYLQWLEGGIAPQVTFEILSPNNTAAELQNKFQFYERHGVDEYYVYDPDDNELSGWLREGGKLRPIANMNGWISPRLGIRFELVQGELRLYGPDGRRFLTFQELAAERDRMEREKELAEQARQRAEQEKLQAEQEKQRAEQEKLQAEQEKQRAEQERLRAEQEKQRAEQEKQQARERAERLAAQLRALGVEPEG